MKHHFQLTYSVQPLHDDVKEKRAAEKARRLMREKLEWQPLENIETTLVGEVYLYDSTIKEKRHEAEQKIDDEIRDMLREHEVFNDIRVYLSLMVSGLGEHIEFDM
ncbi:MULTISPECIES: hypothetical protein [Vibrio harveyi group]|uniref:hypothetical protein n=1 Tax=Vibrio harveyi group TaxID=717610 RepID=UPI00111FCD97|nr:MULTISPECIES: hypothetical protein [Vibrio harveyi group]MBE3803139.1 hypothetical protein [Vibrio parahaemolyticus]MBE3830620.1 hypothetical protein [Vibrio parahaemolyticus]MBE3986193.1 hypothetical protein [Vibrio parahaemolyticus]MCD2151908.1 hypothetical protein [Vibrio parahaemolyticus]MCS0378638.1 hypothetical protein [Vibrio diabolicus]